MVQHEQPTFTAGEQIQMLRSAHKILSFKVKKGMLVTCNEFVQAQNHPVTLILFDTGQSSGTNAWEIQILISAVLLEYWGTAECHL